ncbi:MAG: dihydropteroate synthase [Candidatus Omnitrophica bacterium]|nr:dihydropteroate synthase [Candidatus Omnitrophota bacterium]
MDSKPFTEVLASHDGSKIYGAGRTLIMGILNITPDSFSDGAMFIDPFLAEEYAGKMVSWGADIIDVGGESTRPGSMPVSADEELGRILPVLKKLKGKIAVPVSVDTYKSGVARRALDEGASWINDITALRHDPVMAGVIASYGAGVILMHIKGEPRTMQDSPVYSDIVGEISDHLRGSIEIAENAGISPDRIIVDPGIGFGKTTAQNIHILRNLREFRALGKPVMVGLSRKSLIGTLTGKDVHDRVFGTAAGVALSIMNGADIVRVHDVREMKDVAAFMDGVIRK